MSFEDWIGADSNDHRSDDAKLFGLPVSFQGPTYFRFDAVSDESKPYGVALFLAYGRDFQTPSACLAITNGTTAEKIWLNEEELQSYAGILLDVADAKSKEHLTINDEHPSNDLIRLRAFKAMSPDQLKRLVGALLDASDAIHTYRRVGRFPIRSVFV